MQTLQSTFAFLTGTGVHITYSERLCVANIIAVENVYFVVSMIEHMKTFLLVLVCNAYNEQESHKAIAPYHT